MHLPTDIATWLKLTGALATGAGSLLLAWRVKTILTWVVHCLVAHEESIIQLRRVASGDSQTGPVVEGVTKHLLDIQSRLAFVLLIAGFLLLGIGMLANAATYVLTVP